MRIAVVGCGYLGATHSAALAVLGHQVVGYDVDEARIEALRRRQAPMYEPGLQKLLAELPTESLSFTTAPRDLDGCDVFFLCAGTPEQGDAGATNLDYLLAAFEAVLPSLRPGSLVVGKSTVPLGTAGGLHERLTERCPGALLAWNPEFLREGHAVEDSLHPDRLVYGVVDGDPAALAVLHEVYAGIEAEGCPVVVTDLPSAEVAKLAANCFLALKLSYINAVAELCENGGAEVADVAEVIGRDPRIGPAFLGSGIGFGGGCLPKDLRALAHRADELAATGLSGLLRAAEAVNDSSRARLVDLVVREVEPGARIAVLGAAFKPDSDDVRSSPALAVAAELDRRGYEVVVTDPIALANAAQYCPGPVYEPDLGTALSGSSAVLLLTEWPQYAELDPHYAAGLVASQRMYDGRKALPTERWRSAGWRMHSTGSPREVGETSYV
ncbi:UDP-glucose dehydrogenase family protein [Cumulibacter manganitolerans]|uniref:UDP-glucose dehydrogenase family protein n=1 Tax=Cumulibacter manganitolerans TaxID=1884992 RepID=UPI001297C310|nr:UDP-glucose/GDP-mannose dehydrogenase family protein [Cumulibacter manganitolerans]